MFLAPVSGRAPLQPPDQACLQPRFFVPHRLGRFLVRSRFRAASVQRQAVWPKAFQHCRLFRSRKVELHFLQIFQRAESFGQVADRSRQRSRRVNLAWRGQSPAARQIRRRKSRYPGWAAVIVLFAAALVLHFVPVPARTDQVYCSAWRLPVPC